MQPESVGLDGCCFSYPVGRTRVARAARSYLSRKGGHNNSTSCEKLAGSSHPVSETRSQKARRYLSSSVGRAAMAFDETRCRGCNGQSKSGQDSEGDQRALWHPPSTRASSRCKSKGKEGASTIWRVG